MSDAAPITKAQAQGYLKGGERPQCGNCWVCRPDAQNRRVISISMDDCKHGKFPVAPDGWCPLWFPTEDWIRANTRVAAKLGISLVLESGAAGALINTPFQP